MSRHGSFFLGLSLVLVSFICRVDKAFASYNLPDPYAWSETIAMDTIPPITPREGNWAEDPNDNPFDLLDPEVV